MLGIFPVVVKKNHLPAIGKSEAKGSPRMEIKIGLCLEKSESTYSLKDELY